ncbi:hypothetical protein EV361DRAFT_866621 [Lentinula raphanica]|nr:hypothetical protein EV361DRAFT_866621 [Lentinula raphanica]
MPSGSVNQNGFKLCSPTTMTGTTTDWFSASEAVGDAGLEAASVTGILALDPAISRSLLVDRGRGCHDRSLRGLDGQQEVALKHSTDHSSIFIPRAGWVSIVVAFNQSYWRNQNNNTGHVKLSLERSSAYLDYWELYMATIDELPRFFELPPPSEWGTIRSTQLITHSKIWVNTQQTAVDLNVKHLMAQNLLLSVRQYPLRFFAFDAEDGGTGLHTEVWLVGERPGGAGKLLDSNKRPYKCMAMQLAQKSRWGN